MDRYIYKITPGPDIHGSSQKRGFKEHKSQSVRSAPNTHTSNSMQTEQVTVRDIYVYTYMDVTTLNVKRGHEFEAEVYNKLGERKKGKII